MTKILRPDHFTILTDRLEETQAFYAKTLGLAPGPRPDFRFPGLWLYAGGAPVLHVVGVDALPDPAKGVLDHMAFRGEGMMALLKTLRAMDVPYRVSRTPAPWVQWQVFFKDPNGADVEVDYDGTEPLEEGFE